MRDLPSCFGESGVQVADSLSSNTAKAEQNLVTCVYQCKLRGRSCLITVTWSKNLMSQGLSVVIDYSTYHCLCKVDIKTWLFSKRKGCKNLRVDSSKIDIYWYLSNAKFGSGPEPSEGFYLAIAFNQEMVLLLGDMKKEAYKKIDNASVNSHVIFIAKKEHIFGKKFHGAKAQFCDKGQMHNVTIECDTVDLKDPCLVIRIDRKMVMQVKRLKWKFRAIAPYWWTGFQLNFHVPNCLSAGKLWTSQSIFDPSVLAWSYSRQFRDYQLQGLGFSLIF
ncbi:hypothetical protein P3X46_015268 [Hevea brasiliensis]|uniref:Uncharacterized protein n=1 Tax=Hevea brasiliensis TaxID=3981 RepID=A0ABQ9LWR7_HEVBR|nr:hypothetical protein P3X46_015268 [Hevea brasiliensis]